MDSAVKKVLIYFNAMVRLASAIATIAIACLQMLAQAKPLAICNVLEPSNDALLEAYFKEGVYSKGLELIRKGQGRRGVSEIKRQWDKVNIELAKAFQSKDCRKIQDIMGKYVFNEKPLAEVALDRFVMPKTVRREVARVLCLGADFEEAAKLLVVSGDLEDMFVASLLFGVGGRTETCVAMLSGMAGRCEKAVLEAVCNGNFSPQILSCFEGTQMETEAKRLCDQNYEKEVR
jgi:hypothetical protein